MLDVKNRLIKNDEAFYKLLQKFNMKFIKYLGEISFVENNVFY